METEEYAWYERHHVEDHVSENMIDAMYMWCRVSALKEDERPRNGR